MKTDVSVYKVETHNSAATVTLAVILLVIGLLVLIFVRVDPLKQSDLQFAEMINAQQEGSDSFNPETQNSSMEATGFRLAYYVGRLTFTRERPIVILALLSVMAGFIMVTSPSRSLFSQVVTFDKSKDEVEIKQPRWFFRSHVETYLLQKISEIRVERERDTTKNRQRFSVNLIISHSEGKPLSRNYVHYKTVIPIRQSPDYDSAEKLAQEIREFLALLPDKVI
ncbi:hypothetical protein QUF64_12245 [Anaerolineales bacterium HSG6]|nr:hypothetical protein [Anaerolineales bacterium HSG6]